ncbi:MAG: cupin domain-containing protein [Desulfomonile tiedjei]|nr:cupin domain-containing protein [Desulfomonile tiedjei]
MLVKHLSDHVVKESPFCGEIREILIGNEYPSLNIAVAVDIKPTTAHYHNNFEEIYFVLDGALHLKLYDPRANKIWTEHLSENELCVIPRGTHHKVNEATAENRLCVITVPRFNEEDEHKSDAI